MKQCLNNEEYLKEKVIGKKQFDFLNKEKFKKEAFEKYNNENQEIIKRRIREQNQNSFTLKQIISQDFENNNHVISAYRKQL